MPEEPHVFDRAAEQARQWVSEIAAELGDDDYRPAYRALRAVLHTLRDRLTAEESAQLAAQMPTMIRGIYYEGWKPSRSPASYHDLDSFLERVASEASLAGETEASFAATAVATVLRRRVSSGELEDVMAVLPAPIRPVLAGKAES